MSHFLEIWLRGSTRDYLHSISTSHGEEYHPHITFARPFEINGSEKALKNKIVNLCEGQAPIPFSLEGKGKFKDRTTHIPVIEENEKWKKPRLLEFNNRLEEELGPYVNFYQRPSKTKTLHATVHTRGEIEPCPKINKYMLRLTGINDKKEIWFSYDFVKQAELTRKESLDKETWQMTQDNFIKSLKV